MQKTRRGQYTSAAAALMLAGALISSPPVGARSLTGKSRSRLKQDFARVHFTTVQQVEQLQVYNLTRARGVVGFTLGRYRPKQGKFLRGGVTIYRTCGKQLCLARLSFSADKMRVMRLLDLSRRQTTIPVSGGAWFAPRSGKVQEPHRLVRWPVLAVMTQQTYDGIRQQHIYLISLKDSQRPAVMARITTFSTRIGPVPRSPRGPQRFKGTRVIGLQAIKEPGKPPRLVLKEQRIATRFNRCKLRKPEPIYYDLKGNRFVRHLRKRRPTGCR